MPKDLLATNISLVKGRTEFPRFITAVIMECFPIPDSSLFVAAAKMAGKTTDEYLMSVLLERLEQLRSIPSEEFAAAAKDARIQQRSTRSRRSKKNKNDRMERYLAACWETGNLNRAHQLSGLSSATPYLWARQDPEFNEQWNEARMFCGRRPYHYTPEEKTDA